MGRYKEVSLMDNSLGALWLAVSTIIPIRPRRLFAIATLFMISFNTRLGLASIQCQDAVKSKDRLEVISSPSGEKIPIEYMYRGKKITGDIFLQKEYERRVNFKGFPFEYEEGFFEEHQIIGSQEDLVADFLNRTFGNRIRPKDFSYELLEGLYPSPLDSKNAHFHSSQNVPKVPMIQSPDAFVTNLSGSFVRYNDGGGYSWDNIAVNYLVSVQGEKSTYWDAKDRALAKRNLALRVKGWYPVNPDGSYGPLTATSVFLKSTDPHASAVADFTVRDEYHYRIPADSQVPVEIILEALLRAAKISDVDELNLVPIVEIQNKRYGIDLNYYSAKGESEKVGYIVIDRFLGKDLLSNREISPINQMEIEVLPNKIDFVAGRAEQLNQVLSVLQDYGANSAPQPKYLQILERTQGFSSKK